MLIVRKATRSVIWMFADSWLSLVWALVYMAIMARLLGPEVFGVMALAGTCLAIGSIFLSDTITEGLQQFQDVQESHENAAFWLNLVLSASFATTIVLLAGPIGALLGSELVGQILPAMAIISFIGSISDVPEALLERNLEHKKLVILETGIDLPTSLLAIVLAFLGFGVWSIIICSAISTVISSIALFWLSRWRPSLSFKRDHILEVIHFARDTMFTRCLDYVDGALPTLALGYFVGERALGLYTIAMNLGAQFSGLLMGPLSEIAMTVIARLQDNLDQVQKLLNGVFQLTTFVMYPAIIGASLLVPMIAPILLGERWSGIEGPLIIALLLGLRHATGDFNIAILRGLGDTRSPMISLAVGVAIMAVCLPVAVQFGLIGVMGLVAFRIFATWPLSAWFVERKSGYAAISQFSVGWRALLCTGVMAAAIVVATALPVVAGWPVYPKIAFVIALGMIVYLGLYWGLWPERLRRGYREIKSAIYSGPELNGSEVEGAVAAP